MGKIAAKQGDKIMATDTHILLMPSPGGPVPTPTPMPFVGTILSGCSTDVFIEGKPAATVDSIALNQPMHIPAGGPFQKPPTNQGKILIGSTGVFINGKPAARQGDQATTCNDPTDLPNGQVMAVGTVFIGETGAGAPKPPAGPPQEPKIVKAKLGQAGKIKTVTWSKNKGKLDETIKLRIDLDSFDDGTAADLIVWKQDVDGKNEFIDQIQAQVQSNQIEVDWRYLPKKTNDKLKQAVEDQKNEPKFFFAVEIEGTEAMSESLIFTYPLDVYLEDANGVPLNGVNYCITLADSTKHKGKFQAGHAKVEDAIYGKFTLEIEGYSLIFKES